MKRILTYGTFDLFHEGHRNILQRAKDIGDELWVGVSTREFCTIKGKPDPIENWITRAMNCLRYATYVFEETDWKQKRQDVISKKIDILVMGDDWSNEERFQNLGCDVVFLPCTPGISTTQLRRQHNEH